MNSKNTTEIPREKYNRYKARPTILIKDTFTFKNTYNSDFWDAEYIYEVELLSLNDFRGKNSVVNTDDFKNFVNEERNRVINKKYDMDINIRDLYSINIHTDNKREEDIERFKKLNDFVLNFNDRINRRVTKREIVYKKDKCRSILTIQISKRGYLKVFALPCIEKYDFLHSFKTISKSNCKPLEKLILIKENKDLEYLIEIIKQYLKNVL